MTQEVKICKDGRWELKMGGTNVFPQDLELPEAIEVTEDSFRSLLITLKSINICRGKSVDSVSENVESNKLLTESWSNSHDSDGETALRIRHVDCQSYQTLIKLLYSVQ